MGEGRPITRENDDKSTSFYGSFFPMSKVRPCGTSWPFVFCSCSVVVSRIVLCRALANYPPTIATTLPGVNILAGIRKLFPQGQ